MAELKLLDASYDPEGDVLYVARSSEVATRAVEDGNGVVWRYGKRGALIGATVLDFREQWGSHKADLAAHLSAHFDMPAADIISILKQVGDR